jgi:hypothetical protein
MDLLEIGTKIKEAYGSSIAEGHAALNEYRGEQVTVVHVPSVPADGTSDSAKMARRAEAEAAALKGLNARLSVEGMQQSGNELILEMVLRGTLPGGKDFAFRQVMVNTFENGKVVRVIAIGSPEMFDTLRPVMKELGYASDDWAE